MTIAPSGATVDTGPVAPAISAPRAQAALLAALSRNDATAVARVQLPSAVAAASTIVSVPSQVPQTPKPLQRAPSSLLAAQFIAQDISLTASDLEIFAVRQATAQAPLQEAQGDDYLTALRIARGDVPEAKQPQTGQAAANPAQEKIEAGVREALAVVKTALAVDAEHKQRSSFSSIASGLPALTIPLLRRLSITTIKGADAYRFALARNATLRLPAEQAS